MPPLLALDLLLMLCTTLEEGVNRRNLESVFGDIRRSPKPHLRTLNWNQQKKDPKGPKVPEQLALLS